MTIEIGSNVRGTVLKVADYGAIVRLPEGMTGIVHISEVADTFVRNVRDYIREGDEISIKVLRMGHKGRYELSLKQCNTDAAASTSSKHPGVARTAEPRRFDRTSQNLELPRAPQTFEDRLSMFMKDSEERQHDLRRHIESRSRRGRNK